MYMYPKLWHSASALVISFSYVCLASVYFCTFSFSNLHCITLDVVTATRQWILGAVGNVLDVRKWPVSVQFGMYACSKCQS